MNYSVLGGGGFPLADDDAGALDFLHERVPIGELFRRESMGFDIDKFSLDGHVADQPHILKTKTSKFVGHQRSVYIRPLALLVASIRPKQDDLSQRNVPLTNGFGKGFYSLQGN